MSEPARPTPRFGLYAERYARFRLRYPPALYDRLDSKLAGPRSHVVDLGAGTGQAAVDLLSRFERVTAVEPDPAMAALIPVRERLTLVQAKAEEADFPPASVDAVLAGTAFHWMDADHVCANAKRWLRPGGIFAVFAYDRFVAASPQVQALVDAEAALWRGHMHARLADLSVYVDRVRATGVFGDKVEPILLGAAWRPSPEAYAGFWLTTSFATAHARATGDEAAYAADFAARLADAAGGEEIAVRYEIDGALAVA